VSSEHRVTMLQVGISWIRLVSVALGSARSIDVTIHFERRGSESGRQCYCQVGLSSTAHTGARLGSSVWMIPPALLFVTGSADSSDTVSPDWSI
jgi:hypothetical protein